MCVTSILVYYQHTMMKLTRSRVITVFALAVLAYFIFRATRSGYSPLKIKTKTEQSIFTLKNDLECAPGNKRGSLLTKGLTPGGLCGAGELVRGHASYEIEDGIGGSLME